VKTRVLVEVLFVKTISSCEGDLHRHSRFTGFNDIFLLDFRCINFYFNSVCFVNSSNATSLYCIHVAFHGGVMGIIVKVIIIIL
jgi:hypothetical protein